MDRFWSSDAGSPSARRETDVFASADYRPPLLIVCLSLTGAFVKRLLTLSTVPMLGLGLLLLVPSAARAQTDDPSVLDLAQPDFTLVGLPTALRLPQFKSAFRVTHRFLE